MMYREEECSLWMENHQAEDLSAKMARKSKPIPPPLNLSAVGDSDSSKSPLKDSMLTFSPRSPREQKNLPFRKRAHSYSSTQTSSESDSPESPRVLASPVPTIPSPSPFSKSPLPSPTHLFTKRFLHEPIKSLLPSPNTSASFFNNECDYLKSPCLNFYRPTPELLPLPSMEKNLKSPLQTPKSVFLHNHSDTFFTDMEKMPLKSPLNSPTARNLSLSDDVFVMPEPISIKPEPVEPEKENIADSLEKTDMIPFDPPMEIPPQIMNDVKHEPGSPDFDRSQDYPMNYYLDSKLFDTISNKCYKSYNLTQNLGLYCSEITSTGPPIPYQDPTKATTYKPQTYRKNPVQKRPADKADEEAPKKSKKELDEERPRRPMNAFMLFAKHQRPLLIQQHPGKDNRAISVVLGTAWRELDAGERAEYVRRAAAMALEHKRRHPDCWKRRRVRNAPGPAPQDLATS